MRKSLQSALDLPNKDKTEKSLPPGEKCAKVVAIAAQKGGVGKTTTSVNLGAAMARYCDKKVLVVDLDPQAHVNLALHNQVEIGGGALSDVLLEQGLEVAEVTTTTRIGGLDITPADPGLMQVEDRLSARIGKEMALRKALEITRTHYDIILLDCPPNVGALTVNALVAADQVLIPCNAAALAMAGVSGLMQTVHDVQDHLNPNLCLLGMVLTKVDGRTQGTNQAIMELVQDSWGDALFEEQIGVSNALSRAQLAGQDIFEFEPNSRGAEQYKTLAESVLYRLSIP